MTYEPTGIKRCYSLMLPSFIFLIMLNWKFSLNFSIFYMSTVLINQLVGDQLGFCATLTKTFPCLAWDVWNTKITNFIKLLLMLGKMLFLLNTATTVLISQGQFFFLMILFSFRFVFWESSYYTAFKSLDLKFSKFTSLSILAIS